MPLLGISDAYDTATSVCVGPWPSVCSMRYFGNRVWWGAKWGLLFGSALLVIALIVHLLSGERAFSERHTSLEAMAGTYLIGGAIAGALVGALRPLTSTAAGALVVGVTAAIPVMILLRFATRQFDPWQRADTVKVIVLSIILGMPTGLSYREIFGKGDGSVS